MARWLKLPALAAAGLLALPGGAAAQPGGAAAQPAFAEAPVTAPMVLAAVDICTRQIRAGAFDGAALTGAGWVLAIQGGTVVRGYRHPDNMILLATFDNPTGPDECRVIAPTGRGLTIQQMQVALEQRMGQAAVVAGQAVWSPDGLRLVLRPLSDAGVVIDITPR
jgi:hypothetical protein